ncbi:MAG: FtsW/RodA/SpoVE family cell cycle protein [bacterium]|nr:FtsW/RodA/SpoVE family cell cycle protein [bacterium]
MSQMQVELQGAVAPPHRSLAGGSGDVHSSARSLLWVVFALIFFGLLIQISHASTTMPADKFAGHVRSLVVMRLGGVGVIFFLMWLGPVRLRPLVPHMAGFALITLLLVYVPGFKEEINGSRRWVRFPKVPMTLQPSEIARVVGVIWAAHRLTLLGSDIKDLRRGYLPMVGMCLLFVVPILLEPDLGATLLFIVCFFTVLFLGGARIKHMALSVGIVVSTVLVVAASSFNYIRERLAVWTGDSSNDQVRRAMEAIGSGDAAGVGLGQGGFRNQSLQYMQTDYVFSLVGEEFGLLGSFLIIGLFLAFLFFGFRMAAGIQDRFSALVAFGLVASVAYQAMLHLQIVTGLAPPKGMNLPFVSDGGSALLATCLAVGVALGAARGNGVPPADRSPAPALKR